MKPRPRIPTEEELATEAKVLDLRLAGATFDRIATALGMGHRSTAKRTYERALARVHYPDAAEARQLEAARLDRLQAAHWRAALDGNPESTGTVLRIMDQRARLLGLTAADRIAEREARVHEVQAAALAHMVRHALETAGVDDTQRAAVLASIAAQAAGMDDETAAELPPPTTTTTTTTEEGAPDADEEDTPDQ